MKPYPKIQTIFKRDPDNNFKTLLLGQYSVPEFGVLRNAEWTFTEKVDGTNIRVMWENGELSFGGRTDRAQLPPKLLDALEDMFTPELMLEVFKDQDVCLYGEGYGAGIQKVGGDYRDDQSFVLFDIKAGDWWLLREDVEGIATSLGIDIVPIAFKGTLNQMIHYCKAGFDSKWEGVTPEGLIGKIDWLKTRKGGRVICKLKCKDFPQQRA